MLERANSADEAAKTPTVHPLNLATLAALRRVFARLFASANSRWCSGVNGPSDAGGISGTLTRCHCLMIEESLDVPPRGPNGPPTGNYTVFRRRGLPHFSASVTSEAALG